MMVLLHVVSYKAGQHLWWSEKLAVIALYFWQSLIFLRATGFLVWLSFQSD